MVADPTKPVEQQVRYRNALVGVYRMVREEGAASLARGLAPNTVSPSDVSTLLNGGSSRSITY